MKAVNLIPKDSRRGGPSAGPQVPAFAIIGLLAIALAFVTVYILSANKIAERKNQIAGLRAEAARESATAASLAKYVQFEQVARTRADTVRQIASTRFDWHGALADLSRVVPAGTSLQSLFGSVSPSAASGSTSGGSGASALRGYSNSPAFELTGCTRTQDDVARLISRLRLINGVTRVTLADSQKPGSGGSGSASTAGTGSTGGCGPNAPTFDLVVFFKPLPGSSSSSATPGTPGATSTSAASTATTPGSTTSTTTTPAATTPAATTPGASR